MLCAEEHGALCIQQVVCCVLRNMVHYGGVLCAEEHGALCIQRVVCCVLGIMVHYEDGQHNHS